MNWKKNKFLQFLIMLLICFMITGCGDSESLSADTEIEVSETEVSETEEQNALHSGNLDYYLDLISPMEKSERKELKGEILEITGTFSEKSMGMYYIGTFDDAMRCAFSLEEKTDADLFAEGDIITICGECISVSEDSFQLYHVRLVSVEKNTEAKQAEVVLADTNEKEAVTKTETLKTEPKDEIKVTSVTTSPEEVANKSNDYSVPVYAGKAYVEINNNIPFFEEEDMSTESYEYYSSLDSLGRCGVCVASVGQDIMPTEKRGEIGSVQPSGWNQNKYPGVVDGNYLYNRCHLLGYQLTGENANNKNLITGTRSLNVDAMLLFENMVADYVKETNNHVMYRVTPVFEGNNLLASGVLMEAKSVEDDGDGILFCVYCFNAQEGVEISYADGSNSAKESFTYKDLDKTMYATSNVQVRDLPNTDGNKLGSLLSGEKVTVTGQCNETSWYRISFNGSVGYVSNKYLSNDKPVEKTVAPAQQSSAPTTQEKVPVVQEPQKTAMCWVSATGSKYHTIPNCGRMNPNKATQMSVSDAQARGLGACSKCY